MDFWISDWISGFQIGFLDFTVDFWISQWISGFHSGFLLTVYKISFMTDPSGGLGEEGGGIRSEFSPFSPCPHLVRVYTCLKLAFL